MPWLSSNDLLHRHRVCAPANPPQLLRLASQIQCMLSAIWPFYLVGRVLHYLLNTRRNLVGLERSAGSPGSADPTERSETVVEEHRSHNVLHIRRITELAVLPTDVGSGTLRLQEESVAIVEEVHSVGRQAVDGCHRRRNEAWTCLRNSSGFSAIIAFDSSRVRSAGIVASRPRIVERGLVAAYIHMHTFIGKAFPKIHHIADVCHRHCALLGNTLSYGRNQLVKVVAVRPPNPGRSVSSPPRGLFLPLHSPLRLCCRPWAVHPTCLRDPTTRTAFREYPVPPFSLRCLRQALSTVIVVPCTMPCGPMYMYEPAVICPYWLTPRAFMRSQSSGFE